MTSESSDGVAIRAVAALSRSARAEGVSYPEQAKVIGRTRQTVGAHYKRGDMPLSEFLAIADRVGANPTQLLADAIAEETKKPAECDSDGDEPRKD